MMSLPSATRRSSIAGRWRLFAAAAIPIAVTLGLAVYRPAVLANLEYGTYDAVVRWAAIDPPSGRVVIVDVDDRSLAAMGQWPWRRDLIGQLIARLRERGAATIALDIVFAESDRHQATSFATAPRAEAPSSRSADSELAEVLRGGRVVLGYALTFDGRASSNRCVLHPLAMAVIQRAGHSFEPSLFRASGAVCNLPELARAAAASGFLNAAPDSDGILRRVPLVVEFDGRVYPSLALAAMAATTGTSEVTLEAVNANTASLTIGERIVPLDGKGDALLRYRGKKGQFPSVSAADVLDNRVATDAFRNKIVFVGATALGTREVVATPFDTLFAGVEVQATVADNLLRGSFVRRPEHAATLEALAVVLVGILGAWFVAGLGLAWGGAGAVATVLVMWVGAVRLLSSNGIFLSPLYPVIGLLSVLTAMAIATIVAERRRADQAGRETHLSQRLMVQTLLSLTEVRDLETGRHSRRTQRYARLLAEQLSLHSRFDDYLTPERIDLLADLAPLHDIGKVGVPDRVLNKPGPLTNEEFAEMQKHPLYGFEVIVQAEERVGTCDDAILAMAKEIVYTHHERWDGTGYPRGLRETQIPIPGRIMALVDTYDALTTNRVYRDAMAHDAALALIVRGRGTHFDPAVVDAFVQAAPALEMTSVMMDYATPAATRRGRRAS